MKTKLLLSILPFVSTFCLAQNRIDTLNDTSTNKDYLSLGISSTNHGTGDLKGYLIDVGYEYNLKNRLSFYNNISFSVNSGKDDADDFIQQPSDPTLQTQPLIFVTSGIQTTPTIFFAILNNEKQKFKIGIGPLLRFQEQSRPTLYSYSSGRRFDTSNYYTVRENQAKVFTVGYKINLEYVFFSSPRNRFSFRVFFQNDTNGDTLPGVGLAYAHRIKFF